MTIPEAAEALGLSASTLRLQIKLRKLKAHKMGATWYVNPAEVERYARENSRRGYALPVDRTPVIGSEDVA
jgi:excisionase family DNA binding protein